MMKQHARKEEVPAPAIVACARLTLLRGVAEKRECLIEGKPGGTLLSVGSAAECDWTIRTLGLRAHAVSFMLLSGSLFVRREQAPTLTVNGQPVEREWTQVPAGAHVDGGGARLLVQLNQVSPAHQDPLPDSDRLPSIVLEPNLRRDDLAHNDTVLDPTPPRGSREPRGPRRPDAAKKRATVEESGPIASAPRTLDTVGADTIDTVGTEVETATVPPPAALVPVPATGHEGSSGSRRPAPEEIRAEGSRPRVRLPGQPAPGWARTPPPVDAGAVEGSAVLLEGPPAKKRTLTPIKAIAYAGVLAGMYGGFCELLDLM